MSDLKTNLQEILQEKQDKIIPENIKKDVQIFDVIGELNTGKMTEEEYNNALMIANDIQNNTYTVGDGKLNLFVQESEPVSKNGIWVKTSNTYDNYIVKDKVLSETGECTFVGDMPTSFSNLGSLICYNNKLYRTGGLGYIGDSNNASRNYSYDIKTNVWTKLTSIPKGIAYNYNNAKIGDDIYLMGGAYSGVSAYKYNISSDTYTQLNDLPTDSRDGWIVSVNDKIYVLIGKTGKATNLYVYDPNTDTYTKKATLPNGNVGQAVVVGNCIYYYKYGGGSLYKYNTVTNSTDTISTSYTFAYTSMVVIETDIYFIGGTSSVTMNKKVVKYDTINNEFTELFTLPYDFFNGGAVANGNTIYLVGGNDKSMVMYEITFELDNIANNSLVIEQGGDIYKTVLLDSKFMPGIEYKFSNVWLKNAEGVVDTTTPVYIGNGTTWTLIKGMESEVSI